MRVKIKRQQEGGCTHRGNWIMPLVGGNELSFLSISFTICFYLVINESSVWWQQAAGCLLAAVFPPQPQSLSNLAMFPLHSLTHTHTYTHICRCSEPSPPHATYAGNHTYRKTYCNMCFFHTVTPWIQDAAAAAETKSCVSHTPAPCSHILRQITSIILMVLLCPKNIFLIIFNYPWIVIRH